MNEKSLSNNSGDILAKQRLILFKSTSIIGALTLGIFAIIESLASNSDQLNIITITSIALALLINLIGLQHHNNIKTAYLISIISLIALVHGLSYHNGGVRNPNIYLLGAIVLYAYVILESYGGKIAFILSIANIIAFYLITDFTKPGEIISWSINETSKNNDYLINAILGMIIMTSLTYYLAKSKNKVIRIIENSKMVLSKKNEELKELSVVASGTVNSVIITDERGNIEWINDGFTRMSGFTMNEARGKTFKELFTGELTDASIMNKIDRLEFTERSNNSELVIYRKDKQAIWVQEIITRIQDENGLPKYIFIGSDISERVLSEKKISSYLKRLEKTNKELDKFAYVVSHDLKSPLRAIGNLTGWIEEDAGHMLPEDVRKNFNLIKERVIRMESLINGILDYSKVAKKNSQVEEQNLDEIITEVKSLVGTDTCCQIQVNGKLPVIYADRTKIQQVFMNLISNAIKFNNKPSKIVDITYQETEEHHLFSIKDNGPGIDPRFHEKVFQIFQTLNSKDEFESTGIGLAIVKKIINEQAAQIWIESKPGEGTTFHFTWPKENAVFSRTNFAVGAA